MCVGDLELKHVSWAIEPNSVEFQCILLTLAGEIASPTKGRIVTLHQNGQWMSVQHY